MVARPGKLQAVFNSGEIGPRFDQRISSKDYNGGLKHADRIELLPQGGFTVAPGMRYRGDTQPTSDRIIPFAAMNGSVYDLVLNADQIEVWGLYTLQYSFDHIYSGSQVRQVLYAQDLDTLLLFHEDKKPWRALHAASYSWTTSYAPLSDIPTYDYGGTYTNGEASEFELDFIGFHEGDAPYWDNLVFVLTVSGQETTGIRGKSTAPPDGKTPDMTTIASRVQAAILALPNIQPGVTVSVTSDDNPYRIKITFAGDDNLGDGWTVSGRVVNKADAAVLSNKIKAGVEPGEPIISSARGWPRCGCFYQQRLLLGGFKSLPNAWMASQNGRYFDFDKRLNTADGSFVVPMNIPGGERIENIVDNQFLLIMTSENNFWVAGSANGLSKTTPPKHVPATEHGVAAHVPVVRNESAAVYVNKSGGFLGEMRYTDIEGNYAASDLTLFAYHLVSDVKDLAVRRKQGQQNCNQLIIVNGDGSLRVGYMLREQQLTGYARHTTQGTARAVAVNNRNEATFVMERPRGTGVARTVERFESGLLLDCAQTKALSPPSSIVTGMDIYAGQEVWALADGHVLGPFTVAGNQIELTAYGAPFVASSVTVGLWSPSVAQTLPLSRMVGPEIWQQKKGRIHSVQLFLEDTTSIAVSCNGGKTYDVPLRRFGEPDDVPELEAGFTGVKSVRGFSGFVDEPTLTITQLRPGRMTVKSISIEAAI